MKRAIQLGEGALGTAAPNPMVGAVLVYEGKIIGEGFTSAFGGSHAEVNAIASVQEKDLLSRATLYVTLEPCSHFGKTPPCTDLIIKHGIPEVVIGISDPNPGVAGNGIERLEEAGIQVTFGVLEAECRQHHRRFLSVHEKNRPFIILKWAESADGFLAPDTSVRESVQPHWLSNRRSQQLVHQWRAEEQAILVGSTTVKHDNPRLNTRLWKGKSPLRIILDEAQILQGDYHVFDKTAQTLVISGKKAEADKSGKLIYEFLDFGAEVARQLCSLMLKHHINSVIVEGGARTLHTFIDAGLWDEARIFSAPVYLKKGLKAPVLPGQPKMVRQIGNNALTYWKND